MWPLSKIQVTMDWLHCNCKFHNGSLHKQNLLFTENICRRVWSSAEPINQYKIIIYPKPIWDFLHPSSKKTLNKCTEENECALCLEFKLQWITLNCKFHNGSLFTKKIYPFTENMCRRYGVVQNQLINTKSSYTQNPSETSYTQVVKSFEQM